MKLFVGVHPPHEWTVLDRSNVVVDRGTYEDLASLGGEGEEVEVTGVVPGELVVTHTVRIPTRRRSRLMAALPYALEETVSGDIDDLTVVLLHWTPGRAANCALVTRQLVETWCDMFKASGLTLTSLVPEYLLLPRHSKVEVTVARTNDDRICIRSSDWTGFSGNTHLLETWCRTAEGQALSVATNDAVLKERLATHFGDRVVEWDIGSCFTDWLQLPSKEPLTANLLQGEFAPRKQSDPAKLKWVAAAALCLALVARVGADSVEYLWLERRLDQLDTQITAVFRQHFPEVSRIVEPRVQFEREMQRLRATAARPDEFLILLSAVAQATSTVGGRVEAIDYRETAMTVTLSIANFALLDQVVERLARDSRVDVELIVSGSRDNQVSGQVRVVSAGRRV